MSDIKQKSKNNICVIIPTYNNAKTIESVVYSVLEYCTDVYVVNDGSTDNTLDILNSIEGINLISYNENQGKGYALKKGFYRALNDGFDFAITIDSDGQHNPEDIVVILHHHSLYPEDLIVGSRNIQAEGMPSKNTFANKFSNFWFWAETGQKLPDTQSGFRLYPIHKYKNTKWFTTKYEFELEVLVRSHWSDINISSVSVCVFYPPEEERVSHFKPLRDFARISVLNTFLVLIALLYVYPIRLVKYLINNKFTAVVKEQMLKHNESPFKLASAMGFGVFMGIVPIWGLQMLFAAIIAHFLRLNKIIVLAFSNISLPPIIPFIIYFSYKIGGMFFESEMEITFETVGYFKEQIMTGNFYQTLSEFGYNILQYIIGGIVLAVVSGLLVFIISYTSIRIINFTKSGSANE
ncbi:MAG: DUF2062 domain-containing protein [Marinilabiliales bacterium]|nr:MAG: DUF2062 domain-containing protein [Marinilabiliales bacterium]